MQNEKCEFAHSSFYSYSPLICSIPICATHLMTTESMGVLLYFYRVNSFRSQIHPTPIFITKRIVGHITWGIVNSLPKSKPERISPGFSEINICCMKFNRIRNLDVHVWPYVTNHAEFTLQMHLFPLFIILGTCFIYSQINIDTFLSFSILFCFMYIMVWNFNVQEKKS